MPLEREIKLRFDSADDARERILSIGATPLRGRRLQEDSLLDTADDRLYKRRCVLRVRTESGKAILTFKGPVQPGIMKTREEHETVAADGDTLLTILRELGLRVWFRYEKYREEFAAEDVIIAIDETPVGAFVEIEGGEEHIHQTAAALGKTPEDYITDSYRTVFVRYCQARGLPDTDMVFGVVGDPAAAAVGSPHAE
jgi:adenylate cyclase class 2